jgi:membrane protein required for colicin V production
MTSFDALLIAVFAISIFFAAIRGATRELGTLISVLLAGLIAWISLKPVLGLFGATGSFIAGALAIAIVSAVSFIVFQIIASKLIARFAPTGRARRFDRIGGGVFGFVRALLLLGLAYLGYGYYLDEASRPESVKNAALLPLLDGAANMIEKLAPDLDDAATETGDDDDESTPEETTTQAQETSYDRQDRASLSKLVTTVTTTDENAARPTAVAPPQSDDTDAIAAILTSDSAAPERKSDASGNNKGDR